MPQRRLRSAREEVGFRQSSFVPALFVTRSPSVLDRLNLLGPWPVVFSSSRWLVTSEVSEVSASAKRRRPTDRRHHEVGLAT